MNPLFEPNLYAHGNLVTHSICNFLVYHSVFYVSSHQGWQELCFFKDGLNCE